MRKIIMLSCAVLMAGSLSGCATLFKGNTSNVMVSSNPSDAEIFVDGVSYGRTPLQLKLVSNKTYTISVRANGKEKNYTLNNKIGTVWVVLDVLSGIAPIAVDAITGAWYDLEPSNINADLK